MTVAKQACLGVSLVVTTTTVVKGCVSLRCALSG